MDKSLITNLENKITHLSAFAAVSSACDFSNLNNDIQASFLHGLSELACEIEKDFQLVIEQLIKNN